MKPKIIMKIIIAILAMISIGFGLTIYLAFKEYRTLVVVGDEVDKLKTDVFQRRLVADDYLMYQSIRPKEQWQIKQEEINQFLKNQQSLSYLSESQSILTEIGNSIIKSQQIFDQIVNLIENNHEGLSSTNLSRLTSQLTLTAQETISLAGELSRQVSLKKENALHEFILLSSILIFIYAALLLVSFIIIWLSIGLLQKVDEMKSDFISLVSHQLKTPVAQIKGYAENMLEGLTGELSSKQKDYIGDMLKVANNNSQLIDDLLNISRIERGMLKVNLGSLEVNSLVSEVLSPLRAVAEKKGVNLTSTLLKDPVNIVGDVVKTKEAIRNIVDNALKFTPIGKSVTVSASQEIHHVMLSIKDEGVGIDPDVQKELFEKNRVWSGKVKSAGAGLGLFLSKQFIELTGGIISFKTEQGKGTEFIIKLPKSK